MQSQPGTPTKHAMETASLYHSSAFKDLALRDSVMRDDQRFTIWRTAYAMVIDCLLLDSVCSIEVIRKALY